MRFENATTGLAVPGASAYWWLPELIHLNYIAAVLGIVATTLSICWLFLQVVEKLENRRNNK